MVERISAKNESATTEEFNAALKEAIDSERQKEGNSNRDEVGATTPSAPKSPDQQQDESKPIREAGTDGQEERQPAVEGEKAKPDEQEQQQRPRGKEKPVQSDAEANKDKSPGTGDKVAKTWNKASESERATLLKDVGHSVEFSERKAKEWMTWNAIPEGAVKQRLRDAFEKSKATKENEKAVGKAGTPVEAKTEEN